MHDFVCRSTSVPFRRFLGDVRREFMQRLSAALRGTLGSYLRDALKEGNADDVACLPVPRAKVISSFILFPRWYDQSTSAVEQQVVVLLSRAGDPAALTHIYSSMR
jgi:hypothetical protein